MPRNPPPNPSPSLTTIPFLKLHGLGNDFMVLDWRGQTPSSQPSPTEIQQWGHRQGGVGFDQLIIITNIEAGQSSLETPMADAHLRFFNQDGSEAGACGNGTRAVAGWLMQQAKQRQITLITERGSLSCQAFYKGDDSYGEIQVNMGCPVWSWAKIPLSQEVNLLKLPLILPKEWPLIGGPLAVGMGNPHCVIPLSSFEAINLDSWGKSLELHPLFPQRCNIGFIAPLPGGKPNQWRLRVWERGVGFTLACGSGACAAGVALSKLSLYKPQAGQAKLELFVDGSYHFKDSQDLPQPLRVEWSGHDSDGVQLSGPWAFVYQGYLYP